MANSDGSTCAHIAASKGSVAVIKELLRFDRIGVTTAKNKVGTNDRARMAKWYGTIEYRSDDVTKNVVFFALQHSEYHVSVEHDVKHPQPKFGGNLFMEARDMAA